MTLSHSQHKILRTVIGVAFLAVVLFLFLKSGLREEMSVERLHELGANPWTPVLIIVAMTGAWAYALPASVFFFITPLLFPPLAATAVICAGSAAGTTMGYVAARYIGGPWVERFRDHRVTRFIEQHATFPSIFAIRIFPSSPHGFLNYGAGLMKIPLFKFLVATLLAIGIKAYLYSVAISNSVGATSILDALNWQTVTATMLLSALGIAGHFWQKRWGLQKEE
ncbi:MAG TPA: VTT domain-containing protein [Bacteroidota bacterium]